MTEGLAINFLKWLPKQWTDLSRLESNKSLTGFSRSVAINHMPGFQVQECFSSANFGPKPEEALKSARILEYKYNVMI